MALVYPSAIVPTGEKVTLSVEVQLLLLLLLLLFLEVHMAASNRPWNSMVKEHINVGLGKGDKNHTDIRTCAKKGLEDNTIADVFTKALRS